MSELKTYAVWDAGTRWFHWINVLCILGLAGIGLVILNADNIELPGDGELPLKRVHALIGYVFLLNMLWRFVWGFIGNRYARWGAILPGGKGYFASLTSYVSAFLGGRSHNYLGHNPAGRIGVALLLLCMIVQGTTGLVLAGTDVFYPPFGHYFQQWLAAPGIDPSTVMPRSPDMYDPAAFESWRAFRRPIAEVHEFNFYALATVIVLHVAAVVITEVREGGGIISAMFTGRKVISGEPVDK